MKNSRHSYCPSASRDHGRPDWSTIALFPMTPAVTSHSPWFTSGSHNPLLDLAWETRSSGALSTTQNPDTSGWMRSWTWLPPGVSSRFWGEGFPSRCHGGSLWLTGKYWFSYFLKYRPETLSLTSHMTVVCDASKFLNHKLLILKYFYQVAYE